jgi:hypothetical protein
LFDVRGAQHVACVVVLFQGGWRRQFLKKDRKTSLPRKLHLTSADKVIEVVCGAKPSLQKFIERLQVLQPPVLTRPYLAQIPAQIDEACVALDFFLPSHARVSSILVRTKRARWRLSLGSIGTGLKRKFVKQTKVNSGLAYQRNYDGTICQKRRVSAEDSWSSGWRAAASGRDFPTAGHGKNGKIGRARRTEASTCAA